MGLREKSQLMVGLASLTSIAILIFSLFMLITSHFSRVSEATAGSRDGWQQPETVISDLEIRPGMTIADIGSGDGYFTLRLARETGVSGKIFAIDIRRDLLEALKKKADLDQLKNIVNILSEPTDTKLPAESLDIAFMCDVIHEVSDPQKLPLIMDIKRALKPGGIFFFLDYKRNKNVPFDSYQNLIPRKKLIKIFEKAGFLLDAEFHYLKYQVFFCFKKPSLFNLKDS